MEALTVAKQTRIHHGRLATRLREEHRNPEWLVLTALNKKNLRHRGEVLVKANPTRFCPLLKPDDEFRIYIDRETRLPAQTEILEDDPLDGDSSYTLRYGD